MGNLVFVPLSDEMLYEHPELIRGRVFAYTPDWRDQPRVGRLDAGHVPTPKAQVDAAKKHEKAVVND
jgi:hypothetical protein